MSQFFDTFFNLGMMWESLPQLLTVGLPNTIFLTVLSFALAVVIGLLLCIGMIGPYRPVVWFARGFVDVWRGLPAILSIVLIGSGLPLAGFDVFGRNTYAYAIVALGIVNGSFLGEIFRSGVQSIDVGQTEAARSLGVSRGKTMALILMPQGLRRVIPASMNQFITTLKETALVYVLGLTASRRELFSIGNDAAAATGNYSVMVASAAFFLLITIPLTHLVNAWDRRLRQGRGGRRRGTPVGPGNVVSPLPPGLALQPKGLVEP